MSDAVDSGDDMLWSWSDDEPAGAGAAAVGPGTGSSGMEEAALGGSGLDGAEGGLAGPANGQDAELQGLQSEFLVGVRDEPELQRSVMDQAARHMQEQVAEQERSRLAKTLRDKQDLRRQIDAMVARLNSAQTKDSERTSLRKRIADAEARLASLRRDEASIRRRLERGLGGRRGGAASDGESAGGDDEGGGLQETARERLIRTGRITPFDRVNGLGRSAVAHEADGGRPHAGPEDAPHKGRGEDGRSPRASKRRRGSTAESHDGSDGEFNPDSDGGQEDDLGGVEGSESDGGYSGKRTKAASVARMSRDEDRYKDDGDEVSYQRRLRAWAVERRLRRAKHTLGDAFDEDMARDELEQDLEREMCEPSGFAKDKSFEGGFSVPGEIYRQLFAYQRTCVKWLWELHCQEVGGLIGDEMGLGKTIQIIAFLAGLSFSGKLKGPVIVVCPATVLKQWVQEFHRWWPPMRVAILHSSGSGIASEAMAYDYDSDDAGVGYRGSRSAGSDESDSDGSEEFGGRRSRKRAGRKKQKKGKASPPKISEKSRQQARNLVSKICRTGHVIVTTYAAVRIHAETLLAVKWAYSILDEGHKIRNPDSEITMACKRFKASPMLAIRASAYTPHRIILSGTPIQNNLTELWSIYDFVFPGRLGTLPVFQTQFAVPIRLGAYANANNVQVQTAYKCACILRDLIAPYMLRRMKADVAADLPAKNEQVLFCRLTKPQRQSYERYLASKDVQDILQGKFKVLAGVDVLRKICNHPDLLHVSNAEKPEDYGAVSKSGKLIVVKALLQMWKRLGHRVLLFSQTRQMLDILQQFVRHEGGCYVHLRMDGTTAVQQRAPLVDRFNDDPSIFLFLLTTKVGGLGINLTGADRVVIFDPDWNPSTDMQARERAWRVGQKKSVTIYRLMTSGTIEEKIYHRQIFKQFMTNKILKDPRQRRFFKSNDLHDLFMLGGSDEATTETGDLFRGASVPVDIHTAQGTNAHAQAGKLAHKRPPRRRDLADEELENIQGLDKVDEYKPPAAADADEDEDGAARTGDGDQGNQAGGGKPTPGAAGDDDARILKALFSKTGLHSALQHDAIMDASNPEAQIVEREASRVADAAIAALKRSRRKVRQGSGGVGQPTWTGRSGSAGAPVPKLASNPFGTRSGAGGNSAQGLSSVELLAGLRARADPGRVAARGDQETLGWQSSNAAASITPGSAFAVQAAAMASARDEAEIDPESQQGMILQIRERLVVSGGYATTADLVGALRMRLSPDTVPLFRKMLKGIADFEKHRTGPGVWRIKDEFL
ncbi:DNA repair protein rhp26 [Polyrhizophydium stewartii]|uniref:DNA repair protein rhp26 n=1 Tax=Polyrhizophydium stewartii TaxID=2732419 RepID=A0ABR4NJF0_9FUNG|nr:hypothetical protein HK105_001251 [Polyrhizophydium stewartii]